MYKMHVCVYSYNFCFRLNDYFEINEMFIFLIPSKFFFKHTRPSGDKGFTNITFYIFNKLNIHPFYCMYVN